MTEDQIKAIAEEYMHDKEVHCSWHVTNILRELVREAFIDAINLIQKNYCIVEREKVMEKYNEVKAINDACDGLLADDRAVFHYLFGTSMFKQNESENGSN